MAVIVSKKRLSGIKINHNKNTSEKQTENFSVPDIVKIPMLQHMGAPCNPLVKKGDYVFVGQKIGDNESFFCVPVHSSVSGTVIDISDYTLATGNTCKLVTIETDKKQLVDESCKAPTVNSKDEFINAVKESGLVGLGGAGFPAFIKLNYKDIEKVKYLVINAAECEPYITSDYRECIENTQNIVDGVRAVKKYLNIENVYIGIESNKPNAISVLNNAFDESDNVKIVKLKTVYPQGAEKAIVYATTGIVVKEGQLPADCGAIVMNVSSVGFLGRYLKDGIPLISKRLTVDGDFVTNPVNLRVLLGTSIEEILDYCSIDKENYGKVLVGGPMMGLAVDDLSSPVVKNNNAITVLSQKASQELTTTACIRCGRCIKVCPVNLMPAKLERAYDSRDPELLKELHLSLCINCGCCSFICPARRHLAQKNQVAKVFLKNKTEAKA